MWGHLGALPLLLNLALLLTLLLLVLLYYLLYYVALLYYSLYYSGCGGWDRVCCMTGHLGAIVSLAFCPFAGMGGGGVTLPGVGDGEARDMASGSGGEELLMYEALSY